MNMNTIFVLLSLAAFLSDICLLITFNALREFLGDLAWKLITAAFVLVFVNNAIISYLVIFKPAGIIAIILIVIFFCINTTKNILWLVGFKLTLTNFKDADNIVSNWLREHKISGQ